jgi:hypothetical protein
MHPADLMAFGPIAPMCRLHVGVLLTRSIDPFGALLAKRENERANDSVIFQDADL